MSTYYICLVLAVSTLKFFKIHPYKSYGKSWTLLLHSIFCYAETITSLQSMTKVGYFVSQVSAKSFSITAQPVSHGKSWILCLHSLYFLKRMIPKTTLHSESIHITLLDCFLFFCYIENSNLKQLRQYCRHTL